ncbi:Protein of unknown function precursor [Flavobacterium indicum GPTSA100-9 = DSM 17447]|uniref:Carboxypeptidase-like regulatory domain-containing protein n=1 Tax=Flavobacterium indicum (strain DSM 17447 / CIP 109464 / GPTSA100-9) TaxID=1094466 RepID=H8XV69_FLAIG|nr:hypothetical protein [Flavobacterium indicum]CCG53039.1 Protein of unknown function precursor [Flavobacterium indicum GPTSA100-9 = DSM 17447]
MNRLFYLLFFTFSFLFSQKGEKKDFVLIIKDKDTDKVISNASVSINKYNQDYFSNEEGIVKFELAKPSKITITHPDYKVLILQSIQIKENPMVVYLQPFSQEIEELIITNKHPQTILKKLVEVSEENLTLPVRLKIYSREFYKSNGNFTSYNDGLVNFCLNGKPNNVQIDLLIEQNRTIGLPDNDFFDRTTLGYNLNDIVKNYYEFNYLKKVLDAKAKKKFDYEIKTHKQNPDWYIMVIRPKPEVEEFLPEYKIVYDFKKNIIFEMGYEVPLEKIYFADVTNFKVIKGSIFKSNFTATYKQDNGYYFLLSSKEEIGFKAENKKGLKKDIEITNYLITTEHSKKLVPYDPIDVFKDKSLINKKDKIITEYWEENSGLVLTTEEKKIIQEINQSQPKNMD